MYAAEGGSCAQAMQNPICVNTRKPSTSAPALGPPACRPSDPSVTTAAGSPLASWCLITSSRQLINAKT